MKVIIYLSNKEHNYVAARDIPDSYSYKLWKPTIYDIVPKGMSIYPYILWWMLHYCHVFLNRDYGIFVVYHNNVMVHHSVIIPGYFRYTFMSGNDLQIGNVWTDVTHRGKGIAIFAIQNIIKHYDESGRKIWYIVSENNTPSIKVAEKAGLSKYCEGRKVKRFGINLFAKYEFCND